MFCRSSGPKPPKSSVKCFTSLGPSKRPPDVTKLTQQPFVHQPKRARTTLVLILAVSGGRCHYFNGFGAVGIMLHWHHAGTRRAHVGRAQWPNSDRQPRATPGCLVDIVHRQSSTVAVTVRNRYVPSKHESRKELPAG